jgi:type VI secretion system secreted protein Hcp
MAIDTHIKFDGIEGESTSTDHKGEIEVLSWNWGLAQSAAGPAATGAGSAKLKPIPEQFRVVHHYDKASPLPAKNATSGKTIKTAVLTARKAGEGQKDFLKITMKKVFVTSMHSSCSERSDIAEEVALSYGSIDFAYQPATAKGTLGGAVTFYWNTRTNVVN